MSQLQYDNNDNPKMSLLVSIVSLALVIYALSLMFG